MESANFIPLGSPSGKGSAFSAFVKPPKGEKVLGTTKEERREIARQYRLAAKKEKKKVKSDAKKQRKLNAIMQRRETRNNEKYSKNKERNKQRAIDMERSKIRIEAVKQAEKLAAQHDPTGKLFNVGEVVVMEDGAVKSVERLKTSAELKVKKDAERAAREEYKKAQEEAKKAIKEGKLPESITGPAVNGVNPQRLGFIENLKGIANPAPVKRVSNKQQKKQELLQPKYIPKKPVIPEGYSLPADEENMIALWDLTDEEIRIRLAQAKSQAARERKALRKKQGEQKKFNKAMKVLRKQAAGQGEIFDPEAAKRQVLGEMEEEEALESDSNSDPDSTSSSGSDSDSDSGDDEDVERKSKAAISNAKSKKRKLSESEGDDEVPNAKKTKQSGHESLTESQKRELARKKQLKNNLDPEYIAERLQKEAKKAASTVRRAEKYVEKRVADDASGVKPKKMRKKQKQAFKLIRNLNDVGIPIPQTAELIKVEEAAAVGESTREKKDKKRKLEAETAPEPAHETIKATLESVEPPKRNSKKRKTEEVVEAAPIVEAQVIEAVEPPKKKSKKSKTKTDDVSVDAPAVEAPVVETAELVEKKRKKKSQAGNAVPVTNLPAAVATEPEEKQHKKKKSKSKEPAEEIPPVAVTVDSAEPEKKKKKRQENKAKSDAEPQESAPVAEQWNPDALTGDAARKDKFLRLLGAKKPGDMTTSSKSKSKSSKIADVEKIQMDLEKQYETGMKHKQGGRKLGLGA